MTDNEQLIVQLAEALQAMLDQFAEHERYYEDGLGTSAINQVRAALAKARGEVA